MDAEAAAGAEHRNGLADLDPRAIEHLVGRRQRVGDHADLGGMFSVVESLRQLDEKMRRQLDVLGIAAVALDPDVAARVAAQRLEAGQTPAAVAAVEVEIGGDCVADRKRGHAGTGGDDLRRDLMPDDAGELRLPATGLDVLDGQA
jgi:hypothetical protein